nr:hypothetical protein [Tanacetum cinerariifolium]
MDVKSAFLYDTIEEEVTPIETQNPLVKDEEAVNVDVHLYRSMIRSLMYLTASRPDIMFAVCACSRFQVTPKLTHLYAVKRIFRYLKGQPKLGLWYLRDSPFDLETFLDCDYAGANLDRKSITGEYVVAANCRGQNTATSKIVNSVKQIHDIVDGKVVVISESLVRSDIFFDDEDGDRPRCQETTLGDTDAQTRFETTSKQSHDPPLLEVNTFRSREDGMEHQDDLTDVAPPTSYDSPLSGGHTPRSDDGRPNLLELMNIEELNLTDGADTEVFVEDKGSGEKGGSTANQTLIKLKSENAKEKRVAFRDVKEPHRLTRSTTTLQPLPTIDPKDKGKGVLVEEEPEKLEKKQEEATIAALTEEFDENQERIDADHEHRAEAIRNKPPIRTQVKNRMITYLKPMGKYTHQQLKHKTFEELQKLYQMEQKWIDDFVPMDSKKEEKKSVEPKSKGKKGKRIKRVTDSALKQKSSKKQKMTQEQESAKSDEEESAGYEHEIEELRIWLTVVSDEEETIDP